jgi:hypothetical protein
MPIPVVKKRKSLSKEDANRRPFLSPAFSLVRIPGFKGMLNHIERLPVPGRPHWGYKFIGMGVPGNSLDDHGPGQPFQKIADQVHIFLLF